jgi:hypothetical protein
MADLKALDEPDISRRDEAIKKKPLPIGRNPQEPWEEPAIRAFPEGRASAFEIG